LWVKGETLYKKERSNVIMILPNVDTIVFGVHFEYYDMMIDEKIDTLENLKQYAKNLDSEQSKDISTYKGNGKTFEVLGNGKRGYAYILHNDDYELNIAKGLSRNAVFSPVMVRIKSEKLWRDGLEKSYKEIIAWLHLEIADVLEEKISRIDLCCHTDIFKIDYEDINLFKGRYYNDNIYRFRRKISGMYFGSGSTNRIYCRIYNKSLEVEQKNKKKWFYDIWKSNEGYCSKVWNIEFQLKREFLKEYKINTIEDIIKYMGNVWDYLTKSWLVKVMDDRSRIENCSTDKRWEMIQNAFDEYDRNKGFIKKEKQLNKDADVLIPSILGNLTTFAAKAGKEEIINTMQSIIRSSDKYFKNKDTSFQKVVEGKKLLLGEDKPEFNIDKTYKNISREGV
jgi:hypothetical protein